MHRAAGIGCFLVSAFAAVAIHCGGQLTDDDASRGTSPLAGDQANGTSSSHAPALLCTTVFLDQCVPLDQLEGTGGWGCATDGSEKELACTHDVGAATAHCNCAGMIGDPEPVPPPFPSAEGGAPTPAPIDWFDVPATDTQFTSAQMLQLWGAHCNSACKAPNPPPPVYVFGDAGH